MEWWIQVGYSLYIFRVYCAVVTELGRNIHLEQYCSVFNPQFESKNEVARFLLCMVLNVFSLDSATSTHFVVFKTHSQGAIHD